MKFTDLGLGETLLKAIAECGYESPTPIQEQAIPIIQMARDVVGLAQTGTGKTASFILPMIDYLDGGRAKARMPRSLVLEPTRELAAQVAENFDKYGKYHKLSKALLVGGESLAEQTKILDQGADVLIATPGRLLDLFERGSILLNDIRILVIDEADRMLDMGFIPDIEKIVSLIPPTRQTLLFSATMPPEIKKLSEKFLQNPKTVSVAATSSTSENVHQSIVWANHKFKKNILVSLIEAEDVENAFVFCNRKRDVDFLAKWLTDKGYKAAGLHGDMVQKKRYETLDAFKAGGVELLICSDVAARGLDVDEVSHVFNFDVPTNAEDYVHRVGRTGRAGHKGRAWMIATKEDDKHVKAIEKLIDKEIFKELPDDINESWIISLKQGSSKSRGQESSGDKSDSRGGQRDRHDNKHDNKNNRSRHNRSDRDNSPRSQNKRRYPNESAQANDCNEPLDIADDVKGFGEDVPSFFQS